MLEAAGDRGSKGLAEVARLRRVSLPHLLEQKQPCFIFRFDFPLLALRHLERLDSVARALARYGAADLLEGAAGLLDLAPVRVESGSRRGLGASRPSDFGLGHDPLRDRQRGVPIGRAAQPVLGCGEILGVTLPL